MSTFIHICADDFGLSPGVSRAIAELLTAKRLSATSCMTMAPHWPQTAPLLEPFKGKADIGLHFTLTTLPPHPSLGTRLKQAMLRQVKQAEIEAELHRQIDAFEAQMGRLPDFLDGHQHVHVLPVIRDAVLAVMTGRLKGAWLRDVVEPLPALLAHSPNRVKSLVLNALGFVMHQKARGLGIPVNRGFRGAYDLLAETPMEPARLFPKFLAHAAPGLLIMCHPAHVDQALVEGPDPVHAPREAERAYLASDRFLADLGHAGVEIMGRLG